MQPRGHDRGRTVAHDRPCRERPDCHPPLRGLVSPPDVELSPSTKGSIKQRMVQNAFGPVHKSLHTTCPQITLRPGARALAVEAPRAEERSGWGGAACSKGRPLGHGKLWRGFSSKHKIGAVRGGGGGMDVRGRAIRRPQFVVQCGGPVAKRVPPQAKVWPGLRTKCVGEHFGADRNAATFRTTHVPRRTLPRHRTNKRHRRTRPAPQGLCGQTQNCVPLCTAGQTGAARSHAPMAHSPAQSRTVWLHPCARSSRRRGRQAHTMRRAFTTVPSAVRSRMSSLAVSAPMT